MNRTSSESVDRPTRTLVVWCHDWPVRAWDVPPGEPAAVLEANRVAACSPAAAAMGVRVGVRRREAQARCPDLRVLARDRAREAHAFEPVVAAVEAFTPLVEVDRPGVCAVATRGPSRYFGGDRALAVAVSAAVAGAVAPAAWGIGVADGFFTASWAARARVDPSALVDGPPVDRGESTVPKGSAVPGGSTAAGGSIVPPGGSEAFLAPLPLACLEAPDLVEVLWQLGLRTLGDFAALPEVDVLARFGAGVAARHRVVRGLADRPLDARRLPPDLAVSLELDPPAERVDQAAFAAKSLADRLHDNLSRRGLACTRVAIEAETEHGETMLRLWRHEGVLTSAAMAERARWQLEGWLSGSAAARPSAGLSRLTLAPHDVIAARGRQLGFWGGETQAAERAARAAARVAGLLGAVSVAVPERQGARSPGEQFTLVPTAAVDLVDRAPLTTREAPWPGQLPLAPAAVLSPPQPVHVVADDDRPVTVSGRGSISSPPARVDGVEVRAWAGPWPLEERWWDPAAARRQARFQVVLADGRAHLLVVEGGRWWCAATYD
jgi:protein ImuB